MFSKLLGLAAAGGLAYYLLNGKEEKKEAAPPPPPPVEDKTTKKLLVEGVGEVRFFNIDVQGDIIRESILDYGFQPYPAAVEGAFNAANAVSAPSGSLKNGDRLFDWMVEQINDPSGDVYVMTLAAEGAKWNPELATQVLAVSRGDLLKFPDYAVVFEPGEVSTIFAGADSGYSSDDLVYDVFGLKTPPAIEGTFFMPVEGVGQNIRFFDVATTQKIIEQSVTPYVFDPAVAVDPKTYSSYGIPEGAEVIVVGIAKTLTIGTERAFDAIVSAVNATGSGDTPVYYVLAEAAKAGSWATDKDPTDSTDFLIAVEKKYLRFYDVMSKWAVVAEPGQFPLSLRSKTNAELLALLKSG